MKSKFESYKNSILEVLKTGKSDIEVAKLIIQDQGVLFDDEILSHYNNSFDSILEALRRYTNRLRHKQPKIGLNSNNIIVIPDFHAPFTDKGFLQFCINVRNSFKCGRSIFLGDIIDSHSVSNWGKKTDVPNSSKEFKLAIEQLEEWHEVFPNSISLLGNHDLRIARKMEEANIPLDIFELDYKKIFRTPTWEYKNKHIENGIMFIHGDGGSGQNRAYNLAIKFGLSVVIGHLHYECNIRYVDTNKAQFSAIVGCGIDENSSAFAYGSKLSKKLQKSVLVLLGGNLPILVPYQK